MPQGQIEVVTATDYNQVSAFQIIERGHLRAIGLSVTQPVSGAEVADVFASAALSPADAPEDLDAYTLASGYINKGEGITWSGNIKLEGAMRLRLQAHSPEARTVRMSWFIAKADEGAT